ncbi:MAG: hypothetical protein HOE69_03195 [Euryarchaeota archaeon]|nr:hypothetical protein [Euryarchaeota archaeon]
MDSGLPDDVLSNEPVMPEIPIKPNKSIPVTIGVIEIIGAILLMLFSISMMFSLMMADTLVEQMTDVDATQFEFIIESGQLHFNIGMFFLSSIALFVGGVMLIKKHFRGVYVSAGGGALFGLTLIIGEIWMVVMAKNNDAISYSFGPSLAINGLCAILCFLFPLIILLLPQGKAALSPIRHSINEEE